jgi:hypothetical protein
MPCVAATVCHPVQVTSASNQLDAVAQLLQQTRTALQAAASSGSSPGQQQLLQLPGLLAESDALDELLFLTYVQAQYSNGGWSEAVSLFNQLQQVRQHHAFILPGTLETAVRVVQCTVYI